MGNEVSNASLSSPSTPIPLPWVDPENLSEVHRNESEAEHEQRQSESSTGIEDGDGLLPKTGPTNQVISSRDYITPEIRVTQPSPIDKSFEEDECENLELEPQQSYSKTVDSEDDYDGAELVSFIFPPDEEEKRESKPENENISCAPEERTERSEVDQQQCQWADEVEEDIEDEEENCPEDGNKTFGIRFYNPKDVTTAKLVGEGGFGRVLKGFLHGTPVAIKLFHSPIDLSKIEKELEVLMSLKHRCIVSIFGIVEQTDGIDCPQLILQNYSEGNILEYLSWKENPEDNGTLGKFAFDVVEGCQYLQRKSIIHGNLAARNILVEKLIARNKIYYNAKVSDMGIIRFADPTGGNYMKLPGSGKIVPVRWVPREIIGDDEEGIVGSDFTFESDVWSFGVVLWELWTRGATPYGASYSNLRVLQFIKEGYSPLKIHRPSECPPPVVAVMESIFKVDPRERPTFDQLHEKLIHYKGYGKELRPSKKKSSTAAGAAAATPATFEKKQSYSGEAEANSPKLKGLPASEKTEKKKRKKGEKKAKAKALSGPGNGSSIPNRVVYDSTFGFNLGQEESPPAAATPVVRSRLSEEDATIQALLARVNQLESERMGRGGSGGGGSVLSQEHWKRRLGPPRYHRNSNSNYNEYGDMGVGMGVAGGHGIPPQSPPPPPSPSQAPPPYTESPLPNHSSTAFPPSAREPMPGPSHGYRGHSNRGYIPHSSRGRGGLISDVHSPQRSSLDGEDFIKKIRRLAEEIEVLRAEKMTQELLKKSAELADLMKYMSESGSTSTARQRESEYSPQPPPQHTAPPRSYHHAHAPRGPPQRIPRDNYDTGSYENYYGQGYSPNPRWEGRHDDLVEDYDGHTAYHQRGSPRTAPQSARGNHPRGKRGRGKFSGCGPYNGSNYYDHGPYGGQV